MSPRALAALGTDAVSRYPGSEGETYFYGDTGDLARVYVTCAGLACEFLGASWACINYLSGLHAMWSIITGLCPLGSVVAHLDPAGGGHYATGTILNNLGYRTWHIPFSPEECQLDYEAFARQVAAEPPFALYLDASTVIRLPEVTKLRAIVGPETLICFDASHLLGLLPVLDEVIGLQAGASVVSGSTHKTFPGPQKAVAATRLPEVMGRLADRLPFAVSSAHANSVGALAITLQELLPHRETYARAVLANARTLAAALRDVGFVIAGKSFGFSETHQVWIQTQEGEDAIVWGKQLCAANIRVTVLRLPSNGRLGIRIGVQELTRLGMGAEQMRAVASIFSGCLRDRRSVDAVRRDVATLQSQFDSVHFVSPPPAPNGFS